MANSSNPMRNIFLEKITFSIGIGSDENKFENASTVLERLTNHKAVRALAKSRKPEFGIKKGQTIGAFVTVRGKEAEELLRRALDAKDFVLKKSNIARNSVNFGVDEYIYFTGMKYDPKVGMFGMNVNATFARKGMRVERRKRARSKVASSHKNVSREELLNYLVKNYNVKIEEEA